MLKKIHVNMHIIRRNKKTGEREKPLTVKTYKQNIKGFSVEIKGLSTLVYTPDKPLACGATVYIKTKAPVVVDGKIDV